MNYVILFQVLIWILCARLIEYQASYEVASKVISVTNQMLQELMNIV